MFCGFSDRFENRQEWLYCLFVFKTLETRDFEFTELSLLLLYMIKKKHLMILACENNDFMTDYPSRSELIGNSGSSSLAELHL